MSEPTHSDARPAEALRITRVTTRIGDGGRTQLVGGRDVPKSDPRLEAYGTTDELQAFLGAACDALTAAELDAPGAADALALYREHIVYIQQILFNFGGELATRLDDCWEGMPRIGRQDVAYLERLGESANAGLPPLRDFVLPGGHPAVTALHLCRVVCRRAERAVARLADAEPISPTALPFVNRLSDTLFVLSRAVDARLRAAGRAGNEVIWKRDLTPPPMP